MTAKKLGRQSFCGRGKRKLSAITDNAFYDFKNDSRKLRPYDGAGLEQETLILRKNGAPMMKMLALSC